MAATQLINIKFPFKETPYGGVFDSNSTTQNAFKDDLIVLLTTKRRQRVMSSQFFSPIFDYIHEPMDAITEQRLQDDIKAKVVQFIPQIVIKNVIFNPEAQENTMGLLITFSISSFFDVTQTIALNTPINGVTNSTN